ncbi:MAG: glycosyltransferase family 2 protein [Acidobacteria bacterium]|nr:MAG: glycosyltransferase family 2 protein [Acidobacteriota bacterium]
MGNKTPTVSVITATYNRSNVLSCAIKSVLQSTFSEWELLIIGDGCTDDTAQVVGAFADPRIQFSNLPENFGEQSKPNNLGASLARGRYLAYLNHDDLWFPDHLAVAVDCLEGKKADFVFTLGISPRPGKSSLLLGAAPGGEYRPTIHLPASLWVFRRELIETIGPWRSFRECYTYPSQDWLLRLWRSGARIQMAPQLTVIHFASGHRRDVYRTREFAENASYLKRMCSEADFRQRELLNLALDLEQPSSALEITSLLRRATINAAKRLGMSLGITPIELIGYISGRRKGRMLQRLRQQRGLPRLSH